MVEDNRPDEITIEIRVVSRVESTTNEAGGYENPYKENMHGHNALYVRNVGVKFKITG